MKTFQSKKKKAIRILTDGRERDERLQIDGAGSGDGIRTSSGHVAFS
jgi:predicted lipoprotein